MNLKLGLLALFVLGVACQQRKIINERSPYGGVSDEQGVIRLRLPVLSGPADKDIDGMRIHVFKQTKSCPGVGESLEILKGQYQTIYRSMSLNCNWYLTIQLGKLKDDGLSFEEVVYESIGNVSEFPNAILVSKGFFAGGNPGLDIRFTPTANSLESRSEIVVPVDVVYDGDNNASSPIPVYPWIPTLPSAELSEGEDQLHGMLYKGEKRRGMEKPVYWNLSRTKVAIKSFTDGRTYSSHYMDLWLAQTLAKLFDQISKPPYNVTAFESLGIYNYRNIAGSQKKSRHSYGLAMDIAKVHYSDGSIANVDDHWNRGELGSRLRDLRNVMCGYFDVVLSPDYNSDHKNHFHVDLKRELRASFEDPEPQWASLQPWPSGGLALVSESSSVFNHGNAASIGGRAFCR